MLALALLINIKAFKEYKKILSKGGRLVTDFTNSAGYAATFLNMSVMGLLSLVYVLAIGGVVNGPVLAGIFTIAGFSAFGKHLKNCIPVMSGTILSALIFGYELSETAIIVSVLFSTTLAPIAGKFGLLCGLLAGVTHMAVVTNVGFIHGGVNLYNNGFSGGIVASVLVPIIETFSIPAVKPILYRLYPSWNLSICEDTGIIIKPMIMPTRRATMELRGEGIMLAKLISLITGAKAVANIRGIMTFFKGILFSLAYKCPPI